MGCGGSAQGARVHDLDAFADVSPSNSEVLAKPVRPTGAKTKKKAANVICWDSNALANELQIKVEKDDVRQSMLNLGLLDKEDFEDYVFTRGTSSGTTGSFVVGQLSEASASEMRPAVIQEELDHGLERLPEGASSEESGRERINSEGMATEKNLATES
ncbi:unnamed protein product [Cladocopium goreaui]|uniref:Uncharacterized protein n=1 Tax=Cladocopium goreaui TaxID=2562237 RepID=A0A9P1BHF8_9DINO|nr:unnamed protein product [Cladocopium goreaui]